MVPDFMVIGAQRSGTTWLHRVLSQHPDLWLTPVKELHYFDKPQIRFGVFDADERRRARFWDLKRFARDPRWFGRYWFLPRSDAWYCRLFGQGRRQGKRVGEITPAYATLERPVWERMQRLAPELRLVFVMRDPVLRVWSAIRNRVRKGQFDGEADIAALLEQARMPGAVSRSNYLRTIETVEAVFQPAQLHCCFFEQLISDPAAFADDLFDFLAAPPLNERLRLPPAVNVAAGGREPPLGFQREMARDYLPMVERLAERFGAVPQGWLDRYRNLLS
ncbi:sulfotransferase [Synechococcus sp. CBW1002]|uniref:sulfotransferase family protein n=1 Tax=Synechococcus sp. CBW1002 TaxID=1353134 RepID=UPI0018CCCBFE|nr:sulfotransferase [Synechococcus sp. CBW1002]QPN61145.1 sulfotransferase [Synechococcus sp. CBW1002]